LTYLLTRRDSSPVPLDAAGLTPDRLAGFSASEVARLPFLHGNRREEVGGHFDVRVEDYGAADPTVRILGDCRTVTRIGAGMSRGSVIAQSVGMHAGAGMSGGRLVVDSAGDWLGAEMTGGHILVRGNAGSHVGSTYPGGRFGMWGGSILIEGDAGNEVGYRMRRGLIEVTGRTGQFLGAGLIAGTILARGGVGPRCGAGMIRGTIVLFDEPPVLSPGFAFACEYEPAYARLIGINKPIRLYRGDFLTGGRGEIWHVPGPRSIQRRDLDAAFRADVHR
jgi:formylmethanofuran dehydrogenase subunit C